MKKILKLLIGLYCLFFLIGCSYHTTRTYSYSYGNNSNGYERIIVQRPQYVTISDECDRNLFENPRYKVVRNVGYNTRTTPPTYVCY
jgi:hypothetical protein